MQRPTPEYSTNSMAIRIADSNFDVRIGHIKIPLRYRAFLRKRHWSSYETTVCKLASGGFYFRSLDSHRFRAGMQRLVDAQFSAAGQFYFGQQPPT